jgi:hypothetical protein
MTTTRKPAAVAALAIALATVVLGVGVALVAGPSAGAAPSRAPASRPAVASLRPFASADLSGRATTAVPLVVGRADASPGIHSTTAATTGYLSLFQEASATPLSVSVDGGSPIVLSSAKFAYGLIQAGTHTVTATDGASINLSGTVAVGPGQHVTAVIYLAPGGSAALTSFADDRTAPPAGQSRVVIRNLANTLPAGVDVYVDGTLVAPSLGNTPSSPTSVTLNVPAGPTSVAVSLAGQGLANAFDGQSGELAVGDLLNVYVVGDATAVPPTAGLLTDLIPLPSGYRLYASDGGVFDFGSATYHGSTGGLHLNAPIVGAAPTTIGLGYWLGAADGGVFSFDAPFFGSAGSLRLVAPIVGMEPTPDGGGYWLVASDGGVFTYGNATFYGSAGGYALNKPIVGMAATPDGKGYWLVASDGGVFSFGDASFYGSTGNIALAKPIVGIAPTVDGHGYWLVASDGGVFSGGDATFYGSTGGQPLNRPVVALVPTPDSLGYWLVASDGGIFSYGDASFHGSTGSLALVKPIVTATTPGLSVPS